jgi:hypothetical protein
VIWMAAFLFKGFAVSWLLNTDFAEENIKGKGWVTSILANSIVNSIGTFVILFLTIGLHWSVFFAFIDGAIHYLLGYWKKRQHLPAANWKNLSEAYQIVTFIHSLTYVGFLAAVFKWFLPAGPLHP